VTITRTSCPESSSCCAAIVLTAQVFGVSTDAPSCPASASTSFARGRSMTTRLGFSSLYTVNIGVCADRTCTRVVPACSSIVTERISFLGSARAAPQSAMVATMILQRLCMAAPPEDRP